MKKLLSAIAHSIPALLFPQENACHLCERGLTRPNERVLCEQCALLLRQCRIPSEETVRLLTEYLPCATAYRYQNEARTLDLRLKFGSDRYAAFPLAEGMVAAYLDARELRGAEIAVPVPLHPKRERDRGYNQSALLAQAFCDHTGLTLDPDALRRVRNTKPQSGKTREARLTGVVGAFEASDVVRGKRVLLIDDVLTTGATLIACADALIAAGAWDVVALTASRA